MKRLPLALALTAALAGCASPAQDSDPNTSTNGPIAEETVTLRDGSTVTCLTYDRALDCDWRNR